MARSKCSQRILPVFSHWSTPPFPFFAEWNNISLKPMTFTPHTLVSKNEGIIFSSLIEFEQERVFLFPITLNELIFI